jgi:deoxyribose-phosphate aldolase
MPSGSETASVDLARLIALIAEEVMAASRRPAARCACHSVTEDCCPDRLQGVIDAGAVRLGLHATGGAAAGVAGYIDHTLLKPDATRKDLEQLCREAAEFHFATVCVNPTWVSLCAQLLRDTPVGVCTVVGFPLGATTADTKAFETRRVIFDGAREVDMVINVGALKSQDLRTVERDIAAVTGPCRDCGVTSKVIIEAAYLTDEEKVTACTLAKAAGGVKDLDALKAMVAAGASRVGASAGVRIVQQSQGKDAAPAKPGY